MSDWNVEWYLCILSFYIHGKRWDCKVWVWVGQTLSETGFSWGYITIQHMSQWINKLKGN